MPTKLSKKEEGDFQTWYGKMSSVHGLDSDPDNPDHHYDYRKAYKSGVRNPEWRDEHKQFRWPDLGKDAEYDKVIDHETGKLKPVPTFDDHFKEAVGKD